MVDDALMISIIDELAWETDDLTPLVNKMIDQANAHGGDDNVTCVVARVDKN